jgi:uncharacterized membrane protein YfcA
MSAFIEMSVFLFIMMAASLVQTASGFGYGIIAMAVLPHMLPYAQATALSSLASTVMSSTVAWQNRKYIRFKVMLPALVTNIIVSSLVITFFVGKVDSILQKMLGALLIALSFYFIFVSNKLKIKPTFMNGLIAGSIGGVGAGLFAIGGPPTIVYLLSALDTKEEYRACISLHFAISGVTMGITRALNGIITLRVLQYLVIALIALFVGIWLGNKIFRRINDRTLRSIVYLFMIISGLKLMI